MSDFIPRARCLSCFNHINYCRCTFTREGAKSRHPSSGNDFFTPEDFNVLRGMMMGGLKEDMERWIGQQSASLDAEWRDINS